MIDTHQHLIYPEHFDYPWLDQVPALKDTPSRLQDYREATAGEPISGTVFMEVDVASAHAPDEARFFCELSEDPANRILGVVAAARPEDEAFESQLDQVAHPALKGIRRVLHMQPDELSQSAIFRANVAGLAKRNLTFDLCFLANQLPLAIKLADASPDTALMLDHCGASGLVEGGMEQWKTCIAELSRRPNVLCKLSGLVTCSVGGIDGGKLLPSLADHVLGCFGANRVVWGGDWPICNLASSLGSWIQITQRLLSAFSENERTQILETNAIRFYQLNS
ncbi:MAG: amidohydrolase family protein [Verrucomicrobia bacterium]|nr:amidohydrolase family protein [Verrucomicrobiota bacterium]